MANAKSDLAGKDRSWRDLLVLAWRQPNGPILRTAVLGVFLVFGVYVHGNGRSGAAEAQAAKATTSTNSDYGLLPVDKDGTVHVPAMAVPVSEYLSPEAKAWVAEFLRLDQSPEMQKEVDGGPRFLRKFVVRDRELYPVTRKDTSIGGVHVYDYAPAEGVSQRNRNRVLIELHAGAFGGCWAACAEIQSMPISSLGRIRVIAVDFREAPKYKFPAASEDVAAVYRELLKTYPADNIGIFGCSSGGILVGQATAWFQKHNLPRPGAIGIYCAGSALSRHGGFGGDGEYMGETLGYAVNLPLREAKHRRTGGGTMAYLANADLNDPLVAPVASDDVLSKFPPTQIITGTRFFDLSSAVYTHSRLVKVGVDSDLHVWEGLFHFFFMNPDIPESRDAYDVMVKFFDKHLGH